MGGSGAKMGIKERKQRHIWIYWSGLHLLFIYLFIFEIVGGKIMTKVHGLIKIIDLFFGLRDFFKLLIKRIYFHSFVFMRVNIKVKED